jgi:hypothetical protein
MPLDANRRTFDAGRILWILMASGSIGPSGLTLVRTESVDFIVILSGKRKALGGVA